MIQTKSCNLTHLFLKKTKTKLPQSTWRRFIRYFQTWDYVQSHQLERSADIFKWKRSFILPFSIIFSTMHHTQVYHISKTMHQTHNSLSSHISHQVECSETDNHHPPKKRTPDPNQNCAEFRTTTATFCPELAITTTSPHLSSNGINSTFRSLEEFAGKYSHMTSRTSVSCRGRSPSSRITMLSASQRIDAPFSNRVAVKIIWLMVSNVPSFCKYCWRGGKAKKNEKEIVEKCLQLVFFLRTICDRCKTRNPKFTYRMANRTQIGHRLLF